MEAERFDVLVVGGGPAGLSAALLLARACRKLAVIDEGRPRNMASRAVHNFLSRDGMGPSELLEISRDQLGAYPNVRFVRSRAIDAERCEDGFLLSAADGTRLHARKLILATGLVDQLPPVPGLAELYGRGVYSCPYCDGWEVRDTPIAVYGRGDEHGGELALELTCWSRDIVLCTDGPADLSTNCRAALARNGIAIRETPVTRLESSTGTLDRIVFDSGLPLLRRALFVHPNCREATDLARRLARDGDRPCELEVGRHGRANVPGLFVVGDATRDVLQVAVAVGAGCEAAIACNTELLREDLH